MFISNSKSKFELCKGENSRSLTLDLIKGIGIMLMVLRHARAPYSDFVLLFHMAIFFIASGYLYKGEKIIDVRSLKNYIIRKFKGIYIPYFVYSAIFILGNNLFLKLNIYTDNSLFLSANGYEATYSTLGSYFGISETIKQIIKVGVLQGGTQLGGAFWFFQVLLIVLIAYAIVDYIIKKFFKFKKNSKRICIQFLVAISCLMVGYLCHKFGNNLRGLARVFSIYPLIFIGDSIRYFQIMECFFGKTTQTKNIFRIFVITGAAVIVLLVAYPRGHISLDGNNVENPIFYLSVSIAGWIMLYGIALLLQKVQFKGNKIIAYISKHSVPIIALHFLSFKLINLIVVILKGQDLYMIAAFPILMTQKMWWLAYMIIGLIFPLSIDYLLNVNQECKRQIIDA